MGKNDAMLGKIVRKLATVVPNEAFGALADLCEKLAGPSREVWFVALKRFLRKENPWPALVVWKTITLGLHKSVDAYVAAFELSGVRMSDYTRRMCGNMVMSAEHVTYELFVVTTTKLGFQKDATATFAQICAHAVEFGFEVCPAEVGLALRLAYTDQPAGELLRIAMKPMSDTDGYQSMFGVNHVGYQWLNNYTIDPDTIWDSDDRWVFCRRFSSASTPTPAAKP